MSFDQAVYDSGYFLSNRENDIAAHFFNAGKAAGDEMKRELLEALERALDGLDTYWSEGPEGRALLTQALAAIAKAKEAQL